MSNLYYSECLEPSQVQARASKRKTFIFHTSKPNAGFSSTTCLHHRRVDVPHRPNVFIPLCENALQSDGGLHKHKMTVVLRLSSTYISFRQTSLQKSYLPSGIPPCYG